MYRNSRVILTLFLASSVASLAFAPQESEAQQRAQRGKLPSVELHFEVLGSLRQSIANRSVRQQAPVMQARSRPVAPASGGFANVVSQSIPNTTNRQVIVQKQKPVRQVARAAAKKEVVMQPLPAKTRIARVEPSEEQIIMQPMPVERQAQFPIASQAEGEEPSAMAGMLNEMQSGNPVVAQQQESKGIFDKIAGFFGGDDEADALPSSDNNIVVAAPMPVEVLSSPAEVRQVTIPSNPTGSFPIAQQAPVAPASQSTVLAQPLPGQSAVSAIASEIVKPSGAIVASAPAVVASVPTPTIAPEAVLPDEETIARILSPELKRIQERPAPRPALDVPPPIVEQRYADVTEEVMPVMKVEPKRAEAPVMLEEPVIAQLPPPTGSDFVIAQQPPQSTGLSNRSEPISSIGDLARDLPTETVMQDVQNDFPQLSEVETPSTTVVQELPSNAQEWLNTDSMPAPSVAPQKTEVVVASPVLAPTPEPEPIPEPVIEFKAEPVVEPMPVAELEPVPEGITAPEPEVPVLQELATELEEPVLPEIEEATAPDIEMPEPMSTAEESLLTQAQKTEEDIIAELDDTPIMEQALAELEPVDSELQLPTEDDFAQLQREVAQPAPNIAETPESGKEEGWFPGITKTFKGILGSEDTASQPIATASPAPAAVADVAKAEVAQNVLPPELPTAGESNEADLPSMELLNEDFGERFLNDGIDLTESETQSVNQLDIVDTAPESIDTPPVFQDLPQAQAQADEPLLEMEAPEVQPAPKAEEFEVASLPVEEPKTVSNTAPIGGVGKAVSIEYGKDDTDIPDGRKSSLADIAKKAKANNQRVIISAYASGEPEESKAANMISLSRGLSLRAFFIDNGVAMDRIIVQAKGLENDGGHPDRTDILLD